MSHAAQAQRAARLAQVRGPQLLRLPNPVLGFQARAHALALRLGDDFALHAAARPDQLRVLLNLAQGRRVVVELGTATGWTAASLALGDPARHVISIDPVAWPHRDAYLALLPPSVRARIELRRAEGATGASTHDAPVDLLFLDSSHDRADTVREWRAWAPRCAPGAVAVLHDFGNPAFPGVEEAVAELGLRGHATHGMLVVDPGA